MPGCLGLDALWQMVGFFLVWSGGEGPGRALGLGELKLSGQVLPNVRKIVYNIDIKRVMRSKLVLGIADGWLSADGEIIYRAKDLRVGPAQAECRGAAGNLKLRVRRQGCSGLTTAIEQRRNDKGEAIMRRVVITGMGIVSSIGNNTQEVLASLYEAKPGITRVGEVCRTRFSLPGLWQADARSDRHHRSPRHAFPRRRIGMESRRDGAGDPGCGAGAVGYFQ